MSSWKEHDLRQVWLDQTLQLTEGLTYRAITSSLAGTDLVAAFDEHFESAAFATFHIDGMTPALKRHVHAFGNGIEGALDAFFERLLISDALRATLPDLAIDEVAEHVEPDSAGTVVVDPLLLEGHLAVALRNGGAYSRLPAPQALRLAADFCTRLCGDRYDDVVVLAGPGWSDWFHAITGDYAWMITNTTTDETHLLCASGAD